MKEYLIAISFILVGFPALVAVMSFVMWDNGFKRLGLGYMVRMTLVLCLIAAVMCAIEGGKSP